MVGMAGGAIVSSRTVRLARGAAAFLMLWAAQGCEDDGGGSRDDASIDASDGGNTDATADTSVVGDAAQEVGPSNQPVDAGVTDPGTPQTPPSGKLNIQAWLATGAYKSWSCEGGIAIGRILSNHGRNRVCSNSLASSNSGGEYAVGAASVIELYDNADNVVGHGVSRHVAAGTDQSTWTWFEELNKVVFVDGKGGACASCHAQAGPSTLGHDFVFVQVN